MKPSWNLRFTPLLLSFLFLVNCKKKELKEPPVYKDEIIVNQLPFNVVLGRFFIPRIYVNQSSWLAIHPDNGSNFPDLKNSIGYAESLNKGMNRNVNYFTFQPKISLQHGERYWLVLHRATGGIRYEFQINPNLDPVLLVDGEPVTKMIRLNMPQLKMKHDGNSDSNFFIEKINITSPSFLVLSKTNPNRNPQGFNQDSIASFHFGRPISLQNFEMNFNFTNVLELGDTIYSSIIWDRDENGICNEFLDITELGSTGLVHDTVVFR